MSSFTFFSASFVLIQSLHNYYNFYISQALCRSPGIRSLEPVFHFKSRMVLWGVAWVNCKSLPYSTVCHRAALFKLSCIQITWKADQNAGLLWHPRFGIPTRHNQSLTRVWGANYWASHLWSASSLPTQGAHVASQFYIHSFPIFSFIFFGQPLFLLTSSIPLSL